jgi:LmbE family N-acetylglucosaminyl deacetylase
MSYSTPGERLPATIESLVEGRRVGLLTAHPDDHLTQIHAIHAAVPLAEFVAELTLTQGEETTINHRRHESPPFDPRAGHRSSENLAAARLLGLHGIDTLDAPDGGLAREAEKWSSVVGLWLETRRIEVLLTLGLGDHADHRASGYIGKLAAIQAQHAVNVLELQLAGEPGDIQIEPTEAGIVRALRAAQAHGSQFRIQCGNVKGWPAIAGYAIDLDSYRGLNAYPIWHAASYIWYPAGSLAVAAQRKLQVAAP